MTNSDPLFEKSLPNLVLIPLLACFLGLGCASTFWATNWDERVGSYHFDDAKSELGNPDRSESLPDGGFVATWITRISYDAMHPESSSPDDSHIDDPSGDAFSQRLPSTESSLNLIFNDKGILTDWDDNGR